MRLLASVPTSLVRLPSAQAREWPASQQVPPRLSRWEAEAGVWHLTTDPGVCPLQRLVAAGVAGIGAVCVCPPGLTCLLTCSQELEKLASRKLRINAKETMRIAEKLYTQG